MLEYKKQRDVILVSNYLKLLHRLVLVGIVWTTGVAMAAQAPNPRGSFSAQQNVRNNDSVNTSRATALTTNKSVVSRTSSRGAVISSVARPDNAARSATNTTPFRSQVARSAGNARSAAKALNLSRAAVSRATAVYNDISKIGGGYAACRESYATCMDQFCANANDTYRRCFCSARFSDFRDTEAALDEAAVLLQRFEDNNLNAVNKTAAEVSAMYSATVGEAAIKNDTSAAAKILDEIGDLLSGKKKASSGTSSKSLGIISLDFSNDIDDIWSNGGSSSIFSAGSAQNLAELEGVNLYNAAHKQCMTIVADVCESSAVSNMARSSYGILISQDCNAYQKNLDKKVENIKQTVRTAEKYLREARLEEYRSHNSADVNECIARVRTALTADTACGANYKRCLDYTGVYINQSTGEPIYSPRLFQLTDTIELSGTSGDMDVLSQNPNFNKFLETRKMFATTALDSCRTIANTVWEEFKRSALIEIAQAQDEKIEEVKMSCVNTMSECYDTQSSALKGFDNTTAQMAGAVSAYAASQMCADKVSACAALYGNNTSCLFDSNGKLTNSDTCGLTALLNFVNTVDTIRINEGCETALKNYATELCTPTSGGMGYPWNCRLKSDATLKTDLESAAETYCSQNTTGAETSTIIARIIDDIDDELRSMLSDQCDNLGGVWVNQAETDRFPENQFGGLRAYYSTVYAGNETTAYGRCMESTTRLMCEAYNLDSQLTTYDQINDTCRFSTEWYRSKCVDELGGVWENSMCYIMK